MHGVQRKHGHIKERSKIPRSLHRGCQQQLTGPAGAGPLEDDHAAFYVQIMITLIAAGHYHQHSLLDTFAHSAMWRFGSIVVSDAARSAPFLIPIGLGLLAVALVRGLRRHRRG